MQIARDFRPYNSDLTPITREEVTKFRVRENQPNLCIPKNSWITASELAFTFDKLSKSMEKDRW